MFYFCHRLGATTSVIRKITKGSNGLTRYVAEVLVRKIPDNQHVSAKVSFDVILMPNWIMFSDKNIISFFYKLTLIAE